MAIIEMEVSEEFAARWRDMPEAQRRALTEQINQIRLDTSADTVPADDKDAAWQRFQEFAERAPAWGRKLNREELYEED